MKNYITTQEIIDIYKISQNIVNTILKKYKIDTFKGKKWLLINFKDFHKAYTSAYNPSLFSDLDKKNKSKEKPRKPEEVEEFIKFADTDGLFAKTFSSSYRKSENNNKNRQNSLFINN